MMNLLAMTMLQQMNPQFRPAPLLEPATPASAPAPTLPAPPSPIKMNRNHGVTLEEFCRLYEISEEDCDRLGKLKYTPGNNNIKRLERVDWQDRVGFESLEWQDILDKHDLFIRDLKAGVHF